MGPQSVVLRVFFCFHAQRVLPELIRKLCKVLRFRPRTATCKEVPKPLYYFSHRKDKNVTQKGSWKNKLGVEGNTTLALHTDNQGLILGIEHGPMSATERDPEHKTVSRCQALLDSSYAQPPKNEK